MFSWFVEQLMHNGIVKMVLLAEIDQLSNHRNSVFCFQFSVFRFFDFFDK